jgi:hypothetical protein
VETEEDVGDADPEVYVLVIGAPDTVMVVVTVTAPVGAAAADVAAEPVAAAWKAANLSPGLTAKTIPWAQWPACAQYTHTGLVSCTVNWARGKSVSLAATGTLRGEISS